MNSNGAGGREIESISSLFPHTTVQGEVYFCFGFWARCGRGDRVAPRTEQNGNEFRMKKSSRLVRSLGPSVFSFQARPPPPVTLVWRASNGPEETEQKMEIFRIMWAKKGGRPMSRPRLGLLRHFLQTAPFSYIHASFSTVASRDVSHNRKKIEFELNKNSLSLSFHSFPQVVHGRCSSKSEERVAPK